MTYARSRPPCSPTPAVRPVRRCGPSAPTAARSAKAQRGTATTHGECAVVSGGVAQHGGRLRRCTAVSAARRGATHLTCRCVPKSHNQVEGRSVCVRTQGMRVGRLRREGSGGTESGRSLRRRQRAHASRGASIRTAHTWTMHLRISRRQGGAHGGVHQAAGGDVRVAAR
jgi:hypothetical protein